MFILAREDVEMLKTKQSSKPSILLRYRKRMFRRVSHFVDIQAAIADCREKLDGGDFCLVLKDGFSGQEVWKALGKEEMQALRSR